MYILRGTDCQLLDCLLQMVAADAEPAKRSESVVFVCSACTGGLLAVAKLSLDAYLL